MSKIRLLTSCLFKKVDMALIETVILFFFIFFFIINPFAKHYNSLYQLTYYRYALNVTPTKTRTICVVFTLCILLKIITYHCIFISCSNITNKQENWIEMCQFICFAMLKGFLTVQLCIRAPWQRRRKQPRDFFFFCSRTSTINNTFSSQVRSNAGVIFQMRDKCSQFAFLSARVCFVLAGCLFPPLQCI